MSLLEDFETLEAQVEELVEQLQATDSEFYEEAASIWGGFQEMKVEYEKELRS